MKRFLLLFAAMLACVLPVAAQTVTLSATNVHDIFGNKLASGQACFLPTDNSGDPMSYKDGSGGQVEGVRKCVSVTNGAFSATLSDTSLTNPANVCYQTTVKDTSNGTTPISSGYECVQPTANNYWCTSGACNFDTYAPAGMPNVVQVAGPIGPQGPVGPQGIPGTTTATGTNGDFTVPGNLIAANTSSALQPQNKYAPRSVLTKLAKAANGTTTQLTVALTGDSMTEMAAGMVGLRLEGMIGLAGAALDFNGTGDTWLHQLGGILYTPTGDVILHDGSDNTTHAYDYSVWLTGQYWDVGTGSMTMAWSGTAYTQPSTNKLQVFYIAEPGAGSLTIDSSPDGVTWTNEVTGLSAVNASRIGAVWTTTKGTPNTYQIRVSASPARVKVIGGGLISTTTSGVIQVGVRRGGLEWVDAMSCPTAITAPIFAAVAPDLVTFEVKESTPYADGSTLTARMNDYIGRWKTANSLTDVLLIGTSPRNDGLDSREVANNEELRQVAVSNNVMYWDGYYEGKDAATTAALGWLQADNVHNSNLGRFARAALLWRDLGLDNGSGLFAPFKTIVGSGGLTTALINLPNSAGANVTTLNGLGTGQNILRATFPSNAFHSDIRFTVPTANRAFTLPDANSTAVQPVSGVASQWVRFIDTNGTQTLSQPLWSDIGGNIASTLTHYNNADSPFVTDIYKAGITADQNTTGQYQNHLGTAVLTYGENYTSYGGAAYVLHNGVTNTDSFVMLPTGGVRSMLATGTAWDIRDHNSATQVALNEASASVFNLGVKAALYQTNTNCSSAGGTCASAPAGSVTIAAAATTVTVATTAVTANSQIFLQEDSSLGTKLGITCNTTLGRLYTITARTAGTSFVITSNAAPTTNPACLSYRILN